MVEPLKIYSSEEVGAAGKDGGTVGGARQLLLPALAPHENTWFQLFHPIKCCKKEEEGGGGGLGVVTTTTHPPLHNATNINRGEVGGGGGGGQFPPRT